MKKYIVIASVLFTAGCFKKQGSETFSYFQVGKRKVVPIEADGRVVTRGPASSPQAQELYKQNEADIQSGRCFDEVDRKIKLFRAERTWTKGPGDLDGSSVYISPTSLPGRWVRVRKFMNGELQFSVLTKNQIEIYNYSQSCSYTRDIQARAYGKPLRNDGLQLFDDDDMIEKLERTENYGVIYLWSPGMGYSYQRAVDQRNAIMQSDDLGRAISGIANVTEAANNVGHKLGMKITVTVLADPFSRKDKIQRAYRSNQHDLTAPMLRRAAAFDILMRSMGQHFPSLMVYGNGKIYRNIQPGLGTAEQYRQFIESAVAVLKKNERN